MKLFLFLLPAFALPAAGLPITLAENGASTYSIALSSEASSSEKRAAAELQRFLEEMSGARLPIVGDEASGDLIVVGAGRALDRLKLNLPFERLGPEGFVLKTAGRNIAIAGGRQRGSMYGVYAFLEKLGCRWFTPEVSRIPKRRTIEVPPLDERQTPAFEYREPYFTEAFDKDWAARNKTNGHFSKLDESTGGKIAYYPFVHSFEQLVPPEEYIGEHPEYFSLIAGKRRAVRSQLCLTNQGALRVATEKVLAWIGEHPEATIFSVSQNDWTGWCECDRCRRVEEEEGGVHSGPLLRFVNALAEQVEKKHPDKLIDTLAYWYTEAPPARTRPRPNVRIRLCPIGACQAHPYETCDRNAYFMNNLRAWAKVTGQLYIWHYNTNFSHYLLPFPDFDELAADIPMYKRHGVVGLFMEGAYAPGGGGEMAELRSWVMARLMWDTKADVNRDIDEFLEGVYGRAARPMREYFDLLHRQVRRPPDGRGHHLWIYQQPGAPYLSAEFLARATELFRQAEADAGDSGVRRRVVKARLPLDYVALWRERAFAVRGDSYAPANLERLTRAFADFMGRVRGFGITQLHEGRNLPWDEDEFALRMKSYRVITLENASLRADVVPELNARVIRLIDKRTGADVLHQPDSGERGYPDVSGIAAALYSDYQSRPWDVKWEIAEPAAADSLVLNGLAVNGANLKRSIRLEGGILRTRTEVENAAAAPIPAALHARAEFRFHPPEEPGAAIRYRARNGSAVDRTLFRPGLETQGSETAPAEECPQGEWRGLHRSGGPAVVNRFSDGEVKRCLTSWTVRGENRLTFGLWSDEKMLGPGEALRLSADYSVE
ncbi:MAG: DUF4838 domain-containing protein [Bryobacteraceae bacterium]|nr:DUF4838 domain-containing protein [Bryobacteraceae bacterium]